MTASKSIFPKRKIFFLSPLTQWRQSAFVVTLPVKSAWRNFSSGGLLGGLCLSPTPHPKQKCAKKHVIFCLCQGSREFSSVEALTVVKPIHPPFLQPFVVNQPPALPPPSSATHPHTVLQVSASLIVALLSRSSLSSAVTMLAGTRLPMKSLSRTLDTSMMSSSDRHRESCAYRL